MRHENRFGTFWLALVIWSACVSVGALSLESAKDIDSVNAEPTEVEGVYHVSPVFERLTGLSVIARGKPGERPEKLEKNKHWRFDPRTGELTITVPIDDDKQMIYVEGKRSVPWSWRTLPLPGVA